VQAIGTADEHGVSSPGFPGFFLDAARHFSMMQGPKKKASPPSCVPGAVTLRGGLDTAIMELQPS
jgi:hypothetical protein